MQKVNFDTFSMSLYFLSSFPLKINSATLSRFDQKKAAQRISFFFERVLVCSPMTSVMQVLRRATRGATKHFVVRLDEGSEETPGTIAGRRREDTIECWRIRGRDAVRLFLYRDHLRSLSYDGNGDLTRHSVPVDLYRVSPQSYISRQTAISHYH